MTAKSETVGVVAWRYVDQNGYLRVSLDRNWHGTECTPLVPESAIAELFAQVDESASLAEEAVRQRDALISGLEALAGEIERTGRANWTHPKREAFANRLRALIPAAANTESEEGHG